MSRPYSAAARPVVQPPLNPRQATSRKPHGPYGTTAMDRASPMRGSEVFASGAFWPGWKL
jgi:hypothetical protein